MQLADFLKRAAARPFSLGSFDCGIWLGDWCLEVCGRDPAIGMRGRYRSIEQAFALTGTRSLPALFNKLFRGVGVRRTRDPVLGDAAVIAIGNQDPRGAIIAAGYVVLAGGGGISRLPASHARLICAWSITGNDNA